jgi:phage-related protein
MALNPIMLTVIAITALVAAVVIAYQKSETFRAIVDRLWRVMKDVGAWFAGVFVSLFNKGAAAFDYVRGKAAAAFGWVKTNWPLLLAIITGPIGLAVYAVTKNFDRIKDAAGGAKNWVVTKFNELVGFVTGLPGRISTATSGMWNGIKNAFRSAVNAVIGWWNDLEFTIPAIKVAGVQISPAITIGTPYIPALARGGITTGPTLAMVGDNPGGREAIIPLDRYDALGTTNVYVTVNVPVGGSPVDTGRAIANALQAFYGAGGRVVVP